MARTASSQRRRPAIQITLGRATRLHRLVVVLAAKPTPRPDLLASLAIGLRTFYRELDLLKRCSIRVRRKGVEYRLLTSVAEAEARLPFPDPLLSFAEVKELAQHSGEAAKRLALILRNVVEPEAPKVRPSKASHDRSRS